MCRSARFHALLLTLCCIALPAAAQAGPGLDQVGSGELLWRGEKGLVPLPVVDISVELWVTGIVTHGRLIQSFLNPTPEVIEVIYAFPLPDRAAVHHMEMRIGDRRIASSIREKERARRTYEQAKQTGRRAALVDQSRPNLFTTAAANINPGETVQVVLEYFEENGYADGSFRLRFPLTYTPRFGGGEERSGARPVVPEATVEVTIRPGLPLESLVSASHAIGTERIGQEYIVHVTPDRIPADRDFLLEWRPKPHAVPRAAAFVEDRPDGRYGLFMLMPPTRESESGLGLPTETLFVVDVSGSMDGPSMRQAREALAAALDRLRPEDRFNILRFNDGHVVFREEFQQATPENLSAARSWVRELRAHGGTMIYPALIRGLDLLGESRSTHAQRIIFLTDGAVANEQEVLRGIKERLGRARLHAIGIGHAPNAHLMRKIAFFGRGVCEFVSGTGQAVNRIDGFFARLDRPVMTDLELSWEGMEAELPATHELPDLHASEPLWVSARLPGDGWGKLSLGGYTREGWIETAVEVNAHSPRGRGIAARWARSRIDALTDLLYEGVGEADIRAEIVDLALTHHLVTQYTSLVAVEQLPDALGPSGTTRLAAVLPQGGTDGPMHLILGGALSLGGLVLALVFMRRPS